MTFGNATARAAMACATAPKKLRAERRGRGAFALVMASTTLTQACLVDWNDLRTASADAGAGAQGPGSGGGSSGNGGTGNPTTSTAGGGAGGAGGAGTTSITGAINQPPQVSAGANQTITLPSVIRLIGVVTDDGLPNPSEAPTTRWSTVSGPETVKFANADAATTWASVDVPGTYVLRLTANDGELDNAAEVTITVQPEGSGDGFVAYNDLAWGTGQLTQNITRITSPIGDTGLPSTGLLVNFATGMETPVTLTVTGGDFFVTNSTQGAEGLFGDAFKIFNGRVSGLGATSYHTDPNDSLVLTFTGLDPRKLYDLTFYGQRDNYGWDRASLVTISHHLSFINTSSAASDNPTGTGGTLFDGPTDPSTRLPADNDNGYVARFSYVDAGSDGKLVITVAFDGDVVEHLYAGKYGSAIRFVEQ